MIKLAIAGATGRMGRAVIELAARDERFSIAAALTKGDDPLLGQPMKVGSDHVRITHEMPPGDAPDSTLPPCDVLIDFTVADGTMQWLDWCERHQVPMLIGATGRYSEQQLKRIANAAHTIAIVRAPNFSAGIQAAVDALTLLVQKLGDAYDVEIVEAHHRNKIDAPSGTALSLAEAVRDARRHTPADENRPDAVSAPASRPGDVGRPHEPTEAEQAAEQAARTHPPTEFTLGRHGRTGVRKDGEVGIHAVRMGDVVGQHEIHLSGQGETLTLRHVAHSRETFAAGALRAAAWVVSQGAGLYSMKDVLA